MKKILLITFVILLSTTGCIQKKIKKDSGIGLASFLRIENKPLSKKSKLLLLRENNLYSLNIQLLNNNYDSKKFILSIYFDKRMTYQKKIILEDFHGLNLVIKHIKSTKSGAISICLNNQCYYNLLHIYVIKEYKHEQK